MAMIVKGYCKKCQELGEEPRFFDVNLEHQYCYCPRCGHRMLSKTAKQNYDNLFMKFHKDAEVLLFRAHDYRGAYEAYANIIDLNPSDVIARYGRILALIYMSTLKNSYFAYGLLMLQEEAKPYLRNAKYLNVYHTFLRVANLAIDKYLLSFPKRLSYRGYFYDFDCVCLYFERLLQVRNFKETISKECTFLIKKEQNENFVSLKEQIDRELLNLNSKLEANVIGIDGTIYKFNGITENDRPLVAFSDEKKLLKLGRFKTYSITGRGAPLKVKDGVFANKIALYNFAKIAIPSLISCSLMTIVCFILSACIKQASLPFFIIGCVFLGITAFAATIHLIWNVGSKHGNYMLIKQSKKK